MSDATSQHRGIEQAAIPSLTTPGRLFVYDGLIDIDDRAAQMTLRQLPSDDLLIACNAADEQLNRRIIKNTSPRTARILKDDLESKRPTELLNIGAAQQEILATVLQAAEAASGSLGAVEGGDEYT